MTRRHAATTTRRTIRRRVRDWLDATTTRRQILPAYALLACGAIGAFWLDSRQDDARTHDQCLARAEARADNRRQWLDLYAFVDETGAARNREATAALRLRLDANLPALDPADC